MHRLELALSDEQEVDRWPLPRIWALQIRWQKHCGDHRSCQVPSSLFIYLDPISFTEGELIKSDRVEAPLRKGARRLAWLGRARIMSREAHPISSIFSPMICSSNKWCTTVKKHTKLKTPVSFSTLIVLVKNKDIKKANHVLLNKLIKIHNPPSKQRRHSFRPLSSSSLTPPRKYQ
jgi:hypothetical protein